jgi:hypothetical protein
MSSLLLAAQGQLLRVVTAGPVGEIRQLSDASEIRVVFSEPMVALGRLPSNPMPPWIHITPSIPGSFRWSGTTILLFTPAPGSRLPHATKFIVRVDATAPAASGRQLGTPYEFSFTTPTVRMQSARWARRDDRFDRPVTLALQFNQPVRAEDVVAHLTVRFEPYDFQAPVLSTEERTRLEATTPGGAERFDAKVAAARQVARRTDPVGVRVATTWDRERFPPSDTLVVLETTSAPSPGARLRLTLDATMPSPEGPERPPAPDATVVELPKMFFVDRLRCRAMCNPSAFNPIWFTEQVGSSEFARALSVFDISNPSSVEARRASTPVPSLRGDVSPLHTIEEAGFERQPPATRYALHLAAELVAADGQPLGYPFVGIVGNWHQPAVTSFGDGHGVWETDGGAQLPFYARNFTTVLQRMAPVPIDQLMPRTLLVRDRSERHLPPGAPTTRRLNVTPDVIQSHGVNISALLSPRGTGLIWAAIDGETPIAESEARRTPTSTLVQVTNLGVTVKDSPQGTLVFVTAAVAGADRSRRDCIGSGPTPAEGRRVVRPLLSRDRPERRRPRLRGVRLERGAFALGVRHAAHALGID